MLRELGVSPPTKAERPSILNQLIEQYEHYLVVERNLSPNSIAHLLLFARRFLNELFGGGRLKLSALRAPDITAYINSTPLKNY